MENEVVIHVRAEDDTGPGFAKIRASARKLGEQIEKDLRDAGRRGGQGLFEGIDGGARRITDETFGNLAEQASRLGETLSETFGAAGERAGRTAGERASEGFDQGTRRRRPGSGGSGGGDDEVFGGFVRRALRAGATAGAGFVEGLGRVISSTADNPYVIGGLTAFALAATPLIGGALGAAVVGGAAGIGIVGGFAAAAMHPGVKGAAQALGDVISDDLKLASKSFVPSAVAAIDQVRREWKSLLPDIAGVFDQSKSLMTPLIDGIGDGLASIINAINISLGSSGPVIESFGDMFREVGGAVGDALVMISDNSDSLAAALDFLSAVVSTAITAFGFLIEASAAVIDVFRPFGELIGDAGNAFNEWTRELFGAGDQAEEVTGAQGELADATSDTTEKTNEQISALRQLEETMRRQTDPLFTVLDLQTKVRRAQETYNKAVAESGPESAKARKALLDMGKASFELTSALTTAASEGFDGKLTPAMRSALRNAGSTSKQIDALEKELIAAWRAANKWSGTYKQVFITQYKQQGLKSPSPVYQGYAHGGIVGAANGATSSGLTMVGESGPELITLPPGSRVSSAPDTERLRSPSGSSPTNRQGGTSVMLSIDPSKAPSSLRWLMEALRAEIRAEGGSVQDVLGIPGAA